jgi:hypothetical protein
MEWFSSSSPGIIQLSFYLLPFEVASGSVRAGCYFPFPLAALLLFI